MATPDERPAGRSSPIRPRLVLIRWMAPFLAALAVLAGLSALNRGPAWRVAGWTGAPRVVIDGAPVSLDDRSALPGALLRGRSLALPESTSLTLRLGDVLLIDIEPATRMACPRAPGRFADNDMTLLLLEGGIGVRTGPGFGGRRLLLATPELRAVLPGGTVRLRRGRSGASLSLYDGEAEVGVGDGGRPVGLRSGFMAAVTAGDSLVVAPIDSTARRILAGLRGRSF